MLTAVTEARVRHAWDIPPAEAVRMQRRLRPKLILDTAPGIVNILAGVDVSFSRHSKTLYAAIVLLDLTRPVFSKNGKQIASFEILETVSTSLHVDFPYIPGLLSFREAPVVLKAWEKLCHRPDCLICDGQGIAHPRRFGLASHLGLLLDLPAIGCAKSRLCGTYQMPGVEKGDCADLTDEDEVIGAVLRTRKGVKPVFVSQGHRMTLRRAVEIVLPALGRYRLPEATRMAHHAVNAARREGAA